MQKEKKKENLTVLITKRIRLKGPDFKNILHKWKSANPVFYPSSEEYSSYKIHTTLHTQLNWWEILSCFNVKNS